MNILIRYIGKKEIEVDPYARIEWSRGDTRDVPVEHAAHLLWHPEWVDARAPAVRKKQPIVPVQFVVEAKNLDAQDALPTNFSLMNEQALVGFAKSRFNLELPVGEVVDMRREVARIDAMHRT